MSMMNAKSGECIFAWYEQDLLQYKKSVWNQSLHFWFVDVGYPCLSAFSHSWAAGDLLTVWLISLFQSLCFFLLLCFLLSVIPFSPLSFSLPHQSHPNLSSLPAFLLLSLFTLFPRTFHVVSTISHSFSLLCFWVWWRHPLPAVHSTCSPL